jgi:excisionase family DNA binding protein
MDAEQRKTSPEDEILTIDEVAEYLHLSPQTIYKWAQERRIPAAKLGKEWRFRRSLIDRWLDDIMLGPGPEFERLRTPQ